MKALFFGSDAFALPTLENLHKSRHRIVGVVGRPDQPSGRGLKVAATPVVEMARKMSLPLWQPECLDEELAGTLKDTGAEVGVVVAFGRLLSRHLLEIPPHGFINLHPSLLPRYRGAAPVERALMNGASITGVSTIRMNERLDAGDILLHREEPIYDEDDAGTLRERLAGIGAHLVPQTLDGLEAGEITPVPQEEDKATVAPPVRAAECNIDWGEPAEKIERLMRALSPEPGAYTFFRGRRVKIWSVHLTDVPPEDDPGTIMNMGKEGFLVNTGTNCLQAVTVQPEGKPRMSSGEFSRGQRLLIAERFTVEP